MFKKHQLKVAVIGLMVASYASAQSNLLSQQQSVVANSIQVDAQNCAQGNTPGTVGYSIKEAQEIHMQIASATPDTESLFSVDNDCFSDLSKLFDLSFAIPSLASILSAVQDAITKYAQKKICSAVKDMSGMVTSPINKAITTVNGYSSLADLNGLSNNLVSSGMSTIDPQLGSSYKSGNSNSTYTVDTNPWNSQQTSFDPNSTSNTSNNNYGYNNITNLNTLYAQLQSLQQQLPAKQQALDNAKNNLYGCQTYNPQYQNQNQNYNCYNEQQAVTNAQNDYDNLVNQINALQSAITNFNYSSSTNANSPAPSVQMKSAPPKDQSVFDSIMNFF